jgi:branched-chain amino acid transport system ATP-binding protein
MLLEVDHLCAGYGKIPVLRDISFSANEGEVLLIGGPNGAGKSTLLRSVCGLVRPTAGTVRLAGAEITGFPTERTARSGMRLVLDGHRVFPELTVRDNLRMGALRRRRGKDFQAAVDEVVGVFPVLSEKYTSFARDLSGGQQQMLALGQAFLSRPDVLLCDEPSLGIAHIFMRQILAFLKQWTRSGAAIILVEQQIDLARTIADRVLMMDRGAIVARKTNE